MQVTLETTSGLERRMRISVPAEQLDTQVAAKLKQAAGQVRIKGFRPGKVPMREVKRRFGDGIRQEVSSEVMQSSFLEAVEKESVSPAGTPQIEDVSMEAGKDLEFTAIFEVFPEISLSDFAEIAIDRPVSNITAEDVDKMIDTLVEQRTEFEEVDGACSEGDKVNVDFEGFVDGEAFEGGKAEGSDLILGSGSMIPGFEDGIVGALKGEDKEVTVTFPDEYQSKDLAGKQALFKIKVNTVSAAVKPVLNDEFIENFGIKEGGIEAFRAEVTSNMERELESTIKNKVKNQVMDGLLASNTIDLPKALIEQEIDRQRHEAVNQFGGHDKIDPSMLPAEMFTVQAKKRVSLGLLVNAVIEQYDVKTDDDKVKETIEKMASSYEDPEQVINFYYSNEQQLAQIQNMVLEEQVVDTILAKAVVTDVEQGYDEAIKSAPQPVELPDDSSVDEETTDKTKGAGGDDDDTAGTSPS
ncbi:MAG TPA: trigger factor [Gammaproteobacteria bacterium]|nr:trigger factor [Gammaproteobacteria bacterium]